MQEIELKLVIPASVKTMAFDSLTRLLGESEETQQLVSLYYDTSDLQLRERRIALRVRKQGNRWIQTLKGGGGVEGGLHSRNEWNWDIASDQLDFNVLAEADWDQSISVNSLLPVFTTQFERRIWWFKQSGVQIEIALDAGEVIVDSATVPLIEIELELKEGNPAALFDLAEKIAATVPCWPGFVSKASKGYALRRALAVKSKVNLSDGKLADAPGFSAKPLEIDCPEIPETLDDAIKRLSLFMDASMDAGLVGGGESGHSLGWQEYLFALTWLRVRLAGHGPDLGASHGSNDGASHGSIHDKGLDERLQTEMQTFLSWLLQNPGKRFESYLQSSPAIGLLCLQLARV